MKIYEYPSVDQWGDIVVRPHIDTAKLNDVVKSVLDDIKANGDEAVKRYEQKFDGVALSSLAVTQQEIDEACASIDPELVWIAGRSVWLLRRWVCISQAAQLLCSLQFLCLQHLPRLPDVRI